MKPEPSSPHFFSGHNYTSLFLFLLRMAIPTFIHIAIIRFISSRATGQGDTDLIATVILLLILMVLVGATYNAVQKMRILHVWQHVLQLFAVVLNFLFFFWMLIYRIPSPGAL